MQTIDEISIGRDGDMFTLTIYTYEDELDRTKIRRFVIGLPDQFHAETQRTIGQWLTPALVDQDLAARLDVRPDVNENEWPYQPDALTHDAQGDND